jgi:hypothetical protein
MQRGEINPDSPRAYPRFFRFDELALLFWFRLGCSVVRSQSRVRDFYGFPRSKAPNKPIHLLHPHPDATDSRRGPRKDRSGLVKIPR